MMWWGGGFGWGGWLMMGLGMLAFWALIIAVVIALVQGLRADRRRPDYPQDFPREQAPSDPLRLLDERFARGEIDAEEYQARRELLSGGR